MFPLLVAPVVGEECTTQHNTTQHNTHTRAHKCRKSITNALNHSYLTQSLIPTSVWQASHEFVPDLLGRLLRAMGEWGGVESRDKENSWRVVVASVREYVRRECAMCVHESTGLVPNSFAGVTSVYRNPVRW